MSACALQAWLLWRIQHFPAHGGNALPERGGGGPIAPGASGLAFLDESEHLIRREWLGTVGLGLRCHRFLQHIGRKTIRQIGQPERTQHGQREVLPRTEVLFLPSLDHFDATAPIASALAV